MRIEPGTAVAPPVAAGVAGVVISAAMPFCGEEIAELRAVSVEKTRTPCMRYALTSEAVSTAPDVKVFVAGPGDPEEIKKNIDAQLLTRFEFLGRISEEEKADFMASVAIYVAPNTGGESFGIILAEALAGGATVVASDIPAFDSLLGNGEYGALFESENPTELAKVVIELFRDRDKREALATAGKVHAQNFDWEVVAQQIFSIYEMSIVGSDGVSLATEHRSWNRLLSREIDRE